MKSKGILLAASLLAGFFLATAAQAQPFVLPVERAGSGHGEQQRVTTAGMGFLKISQSARAAGMGDAFTAVANDVNAAFWNPAGLAHVEKFGWTSTYTRWLVNTEMFSGAVAYNTRSAWGVWGLSLIYLKPETVEETTIFQPGGTGRNINVMNMSLGLLYAVQITNKLAIGFRADWARESILDHSINTFKMDVGSLFYTGFRSLRLAMSLKNLGSNEQYQQVKFWMPLVYYMAISDEIFGKQGEAVYLTASVESLYAIDFDQRYHVGAELWLANILALRGGYKFNYDAESYSLGMGLKYEMAQGRKVMVDVSYSHFGDLLNAPLRLTLSGAF